MEGVDERTTATLKQMATTARWPHHHHHRVRRHLLLLPPRFVVVDFLLWFLLLLTTTTCGGVDSDIATRIVQTLVIDVPDTCERVDAVVGDVCVNGMVCTRARIDTLRSSSSSSSSADGVGVTVSGVQLTCRGKYSYTLGNSRGDVDAVATVPTLVLAVTVTRDTNDTAFPGAIAVPQCELNTVNLKLTFSGSMSAWILSVISPVIENTVKAAIIKQTCPHIVTSVADGGTAYLQQTVNPALRRLLAAAAAATPTTSTAVPEQGVRSPYVNWTSSFVVGLNELAFSDWTKDWIRCFSGLPTFFPLGRLIGHWLHDAATVEVTIDGAALGVPAFHVAGNVSATVRSVRVAGVEGLVLLDALRPSLTDSLTLSSRFTAPALDVDVALLLQDTVSGEVVSDRGALHVRVTSPVVDVDVAVGAVVRRLNAIHLENLADLQVWVDALDFVNATTVALQLGGGGIAVHVATAGDEGTLDAAVFEALDRAAQVATGAYAGLLARTAAAATQVHVRRVVNDKVRAALHALKEAATLRAAASDPAALIAWADFKPLQLVHRLLYQLALPDMNRLTACLPSSPDGGPGGGLLPAGWQLAGIDSLFAFGVLDPVAASAQTLSTTLGVGACASSPPGASGDCTPLVLNYTSPIISVAAALRNFHVSSALAVRLGVKAFRGLQLADLAQPACLLPWFQGIALETLQLGASSIEVLAGTAVRADVTAAAASLFRAAGGPTGLRQLNHLLAQWKGATEGTCTATTVRPVPVPRPADADVADDEPWLPAADRRSLVAVAAVVAAATVFFSLVLVLARRKATPRPRPTHMLDAHALESFDFGGGTGNGGEHGDDDVYVAVDRVSGVPLQLLPPHKTGQKPTQPKWTLAPSALSLPLPPSSSSSSSSSTSSFASILSAPREALALVGEALVPTAAVGAAALFAYSNVCAEAVVVVVQANYGVYATLPQAVFAFGLVATVGALAEAHAVALAALVAVFSGLWPYAKLVYLVVHWLRVTTLPAALAGPPPRLLRWMEALGKWSLVDFYVMAVAMAVFAVHQVLLVVRGSPLTAAVSVQPRAGFFAFLAGTLLSHLLSHALCATDAAARRAALPQSSPLSSSSPSPPAECPPPRPSRTWSLSLPAAARFVTPSRRIVLRCAQRQYASLSSTPPPPSSGAAVAVLRVSRLGVALAVAAIASCGALLVGGTAARALHVEFSGLLQHAVNAPLPPQDLSFYDVGRLLQVGSGLGPLSAGALFLQACFYGCGLGAPLLLLKVLGTLWLVPLPPRYSQRLLGVVRVLNAWSTVDVYCVSAAAVTLQVHQFVAFAVDKACTGAARDALVAAAAATSSSREGQCFAATGSLRGSFAALVAAAVLLHALVFITLRVADGAGTLRPPSSRQQLLGAKAVELPVVDELAGSGGRCQQPPLGEEEEEDEGVAGGLVGEAAADARDDVQVDGNEVSDDDDVPPPRGTSWGSCAVEYAYWLGLLVDEDDDTE